ncbi:hypothetical protein G7Y89_g13818 [Cudoniella acicularis]|uniref:Uncharacterized protein n=1 Tax=Cudoniella acicularis TaxID=354080 RepID=A0A8H4R9X4_9HELO|nr:hypothetical protein G7Y89_g13818 [Cudoniella acicularis]
MGTVVVDSQLQFVGRVKCRGRSSHPTDRRKFSRDSGGQVLKVTLDPDSLDLDEGKSQTANAAAGGGVSWSRDEDLPCMEQLHGMACMGRAAARNEQWLDEQWCIYLRWDEKGSLGFGLLGR